MAVAAPATAPQASILRLVAIGGIGIFLSHLIWDIYLYGSLYLNNPLEVALQYIASGVLGMSAFEGGTGTALLGLGIHLVISMTVAAVFIVGAARFPALRRRAVPVGLVYGLGVLLVMTMVVIPLSATPKGEPGLDFWISATASHVLTVGLLLGVLVQRNQPGS